MAPRTPRPSRGELTPEEERGSLRTPGQGRLPLARDPHAARHRGGHAGAGRGRDRRARWPFGRQGPGADRRPGEGRRRGAGRLARARGRGGRTHAPRRVPGHGGEPRPRRGAAPDRGGVLHVVRAGSIDRRLPGADDGRGRRGHRGAGADAPGGDPARARRSDAGAADVSRARADGDAPAGGARGRGRHRAEALRDPGRTGRHARRGEPARPAGGRNGRGARRQGHDRRQRAVAPSGPPGAERGVPDRPGRGCARRRPACST